MTQSFSLLWIIFVLAATGLPFQQSAEAQTLTYEYSTVGESGDSHRRHPNWIAFLPNGATYLTGESLGATFEYDVTLTNSLNTPASLTSLQPYVSVAMAWIRGGTGGAGWSYCYGLDPGFHGEQLPNILGSVLHFSPGGTIRLTGQITYWSGFSMGSFSNYIGPGLTCFDGMHTLGFTVLETYPRRNEPLHSNGWDTGSSGISFVDNGSGFISHPCRITTDYQLPAIGTSTCSPLNPNSTAQFGTLEAYGAADSDPEACFLILEATDLPAGIFGYYLLSQSQGSPILLGSGMGTLCLASPFYRWHDSTAYTYSDGRLLRRVDPADLPIPGGAVSAGSSWNFQLWHRDTVAGLASSNTTNSVSVTFQ